MKKTLMIPAAVVAAFAIIFTIPSGTAEAIEPEAVTPYEILGDVALFPDGTTAPVEVALAAALLPEIHIDDDLVNGYPEYNGDCWSLVVDVGVIEGTCSNLVEGDCHLAFKYTCGCTYDYHADCLGNEGEYLTSDRYFGRTFDYHSVQGWGVRIFVHCGTH